MVSHSHTLQCCCTCPGHLSHSMPLPTTPLYCCTAPLQVLQVRQHPRHTRPRAGVHGAVCMPCPERSIPCQDGTPPLSLPPARASSPAGPPLISLEESEGSAMWLQQGHSGKEAGCGDGTSSEQQQLRRRGGRGGCSHPNVSSYPGDVSEGNSCLSCFSS